MIKTVWAEWEQLSAESNEDDVDDSERLTEDQVIPPRICFPFTILLTNNIKYTKTKHKIMKITMK